MHVVSATPSARRTRAAHVDVLAHREARALHGPHDGPDPQCVGARRSQKESMPMTMNRNRDSHAPKSHRGFATMDMERQREIASKGGKAAHAKGRAHEFSPEEARIAGHKGGEVVSRNREHMAAIGRAGGHARGRNRALRAADDRGQVAGENRPGE
jgi:general stress protein YciG